MKIKLYIFLFYLFIFSSFHSENLSNTKSKITFKVANLKNTDGQILIALFDSEKTFLKEDYEFKTTPIKNTSEVIITFNNIPQGVYAASIIHDENNNGNLDTNWMKIPKEPYAFSNNAKGRFGPASFEDSKFTVGDSLIVQEIKL